MRHIVYLLKTQNPEIGLYIKRLDFQTFRDPWLKMKKIIMMNLWLGWQASRLTSLLLNFILPPPTTAWDKNDNINDNSNHIIVIIIIIMIIIITIITITIIPIIIIIMIIIIIIIIW